MRPESSTVQLALDELRDVEHGFSNVMSLLSAAENGGIGARSYVERARAALFPLREAVRRARAQLEAAIRPGAGGDGA